MNRNIMCNTASDSNFEVNFGICFNFEVLILQHVFILFYLKDQKQNINQNKHIKTY